MLITAGGHEFQLLAERALFWPSFRALIVADVHLGKAAAFRSHGLTVPEGNTRDDLSRLSLLLRRTGAERLIIVGDLFHAPSGLTPEVQLLIGTWREQWPTLAVHLIPGNHDRALHRIPAGWRLEIATRSYAADSLWFLHDPEDKAAPDGFAICGHLHPGVRLGERGARSLSAPCFWLTPSRLVLPAFGSFTGSRAVSPAAGDRLIAVAGGKLLEVPPALH